MFGWGVKRLRRSSCVPQAFLMRFYGFFDPISPHHRIFSIFSHFFHVSIFFGRRMFSKTENSDILRQGVPKIRG